MLDKSSNHNRIGCFIGTDETNGRYGEVTIIKCQKCNSFWIKYFVEYESFPHSGRWFIGFVEKENIHLLTPQNTVDYLNKLPAHYYGGSYFQSSGDLSSRKGNIRVDF